MKMLVYNQKYRILLSGFLHGVIPHGQQTRPSPWFYSVELDKKKFYLRLRQIEGTLNQLRYFITILMLN